MFIVLVGYCKEAIFAGVDEIAVVSWNTTDTLCRLLYRAAILWLTRKLSPITLTTSAYRCWSP